MSVEVINNSPQYISPAFETCIKEACIKKLGKKGFSLPGKRDSVTYQFIISLQVDPYEQYTRSQFTFGGPDVRSSSIVVAQNPSAHDSIVIPDSEQISLSHEERMDKAQKVVLTRAWGETDTLLLPFRKNIKGLSMKSVCYTPHGVLWQDQSELYFLEDPVRDMRRSVSILRYSLRNIAYYDISHK
jgi:hypothetical protein